MSRTSFDNQCGQHGGRLHIYVSQGTRLRKQIVIVLHLLLEPIVHSEWQTNCSFVHVGHFYKPDDTQDYFYTKEVTWGLRLPAAADLGIHGSELCHCGRHLPFSLGFSAWEGSTGAGWTRVKTGRRAWNNETSEDITEALGSICEHSVPKTGILWGSPSQNLRTQCLSDISRTEEPTIWVEPEKTGITQVKCSRNQNSPRTSKLHQDDVFSSVRLGFLLFLFSLFFILSFSSSIRSCAPFPDLVS